MPTTNKVVREQIWIRFSQFVSSSHYVMVWTSLYNTAGIQRCPILSFDLTYSMFKNHWINANSKLSSPCITNVTPRECVVVCGRLSH